MAGCSGECCEELARLLKADVSDVFLTRLFIWLSALFLEVLKACYFDKSFHGTFVVCLLCIECREEAPSFVVS